MRSSDREQVATSRKGVDSQNAITEVRSTDTHAHPENRVGPTDLYSRTLDSTRSRVLLPAGGLTTYKGVKPAFLFLSEPTLISRIYWLRITRKKAGFGGKDETVNIARRSP